MAEASLEQHVGERGIGVQISGDSNTVTVYAGRAELSLVRKHLRRTEPQTELQLLRVDLRATTLVGRDAEQSALQGWLTSDLPVSVRCITGRAGSGKTRLAIELCEHAEKAGWTVGFVQYRQFSEFIKCTGEWRWPNDTLVVVDYAAALARDLRAWLEILAQPEAQSGGYKLRLLLLERHADRDLGWWAELLRPVSFSDPAPDELADPREPVPLQSLNAVEDRRAILAETMRLAAQIAGIQPIPHPPPPGIDADFDRRLGDDTVNNEPLYLMMAGAEAVRNGAPAALALTRIDLAQRAASRERERLTHLASGWGAPEKLVAHLAMCLTLQGGSNAEDAVHLIEEERGALGFPETIPATELVNRLADALPTPGGTEIDAVRPDLIGEALLLQGMDEHRRFPNLQAGIIDRAWRRAERNVAATLIRAAQDYAQGDASHCSVVWLRHLIDLTDDLAALMELADVLPEHTLALREVAAQADQLISTTLAELASNDPDLYPQLALSLNNLAIRFSYLDRNNEALTAAEQALLIYRCLAAQRPDLFRAGLASALNTVANRLSVVERREAALAAAKEAVALYRELADQQTDAIRHGLGVSLNNLSNKLSDLGQYEPAKAVAEEAVVLYRELEAQRPNFFRPYLAGSLNTLSNRFNDQGRREAALSAAQEAAALHRVLAAQQPDAFRPDLAGSLSNLANRLSALWRRAPALEMAQEAVALYRALAARRPDAFRLHYADALTNLAARLCDLSEHEPALGAAEEAAVLYREVNAVAPGRSQPNLAKALNNLAVIRGALHRHEEGLAAAQDAVELYRTLAAQRPDAFRSDLAGSMTNLAIRLSDLGRREPALEAVQEALAIYRELEVQRQDALRPNFALSLMVQANCLDALDRPAEALASDAAAIANLSPAFAEHPPAFAHWMAPMVQQYLERCNRLGQSLDIELLEPVVAILQEQQPPTKEEQG
jgi:Tetratricopeptide repeat